MDLFDGHARRRRVRHAAAGPRAGGPARSGEVLTGVGARRPVGPPPAAAAASWSRRSARRRAVSRAGDGTAARRPARARPTRPSWPRRDRPRTCTSAASRSSRARRRTSASCATCCAGACTSSRATARSSPRRRSSTGRPLWVDDPTFNLDYHVRQTALPSPGSEEQLLNLTSRVFSQPLDRSKPLWEMWIVEGLEDGRWAILSKTHHCLIDGISGVDLATVIFDLDPVPRDVGRTGTAVDAPPRADGRRAARARRDRLRRAPACGSPTARWARLAPRALGVRRPRGARGRRRDRVGGRQPGPGARR